MEIENVGDLKKITKDLPDDMKIFIGKRVTEEDYGLVHSGKVKILTMDESSDEKKANTIEALLLDEE